MEPMEAETEQKPGAIPGEATAVSEVLPGPEAPAETPVEVAPEAPAEAAPEAPVTASLESAQTPSDEPADEVSDEATELIESAAPDDEADEEETDADDEDADDEDPSEEEHADLSSLQLPPREETPSDPPLRSRKHHVAPALIAIDRVDDDRFFQLRPEGELSLLATDLARLGQLFPVDLRLVPPDRFQVVCGFRRVEALRFLQRDRVLARLHTDLSDEDALLMALADAIHYVPVSREELESLRKKLESAGRLGSEARDMLDKALSEGDDLAPETIDEEVDADELAAKVATQLGDINQDLALLADVFGSLDAEMKETLLQQLRYSAELVAFLEAKER